MLHSLNYDQVTSIKDQLEIIYRAKLIIQHPEGQIKIACQNRSCHFEFVYGLMPDNTYALLNSFSMHLIDCDMDVENYAFQRNHDRISSLKSEIGTHLRDIVPIGIYSVTQKIIAVLGKNGTKCKIFEDIESKDLRRRLKKKFDNVVAEAKRQYYQEIRQIRTQKTSRAGRSVAKSPVQS